MSFVILQIYTLPKDSDVLWVVNKRFFWLNSRKLATSDIYGEKKNARALHILAHSMKIIRLDFFFWLIVPFIQNLDISIPNLWIFMILYGLRNTLDQRVSLRDRVKISLFLLLRFFLIREIRNENISCQKDVGVQFFTTRIFFIKSRPWETGTFTFFN